MFMILLDAKLFYMYFIAALTSSAFLSIVSRLQAQRERSYCLTAEDEDNQSTIVTPGTEFSVTSL
jgi:hypothetical protein